MSQKLTPILNNAFLLLVAKDRIRKTRVTQSLLKKIKEDQKLEKIDVENFEFTTISELSYKLNSQSLFSKFKVIHVVFKKEINSDESLKLCEVIENIPLKSFLIFDFEKINANLKIIKLAKAKKCLVEYKALESNNLISWIKDECKNKGINKYPEVLPEMLKIISEEESGQNYKNKNNYNPDLIANNIELLSIYCDGNALSLSDLKNFYPEALAPNEFKLMDALTTGNAPQAEQLLAELFSVGKNHFLILAMLNNNFKKLLTIKTMQASGENARNIMSFLNIKTDWVYKKLSGQVRNISIFKIKEMIAHLLKADSRLKDKSLGAELVLSQVCGDLCKIYQR